MSSRRRFYFVVAVWLLSVAPLFSQDDKGYSMVSFDEKGKQEGAKAWTKLKGDLAVRKPKHVFLIAHGWLTSKDRADQTFTYFGKHLREAQGKDGPIEVIGIRWPSLVGENDSERDQAFNRVVNAFSVAIVNSKTAQEQKEKIKPLLKKPTTRLLVANLLNFRLPDDDQIDFMIDNIEEPEKVASILSTFTYYEMKRRAAIIGSNELPNILTELQTLLPQTRLHLVGHSFGCKVWLECLASKARADEPVHSVTLLQGAVSMLCFAAKVEELEGEPSGAYADVPKRVKGPVAITYTKNDKALTLAYVAASQAAGQIAELPARKHQTNRTPYGALGGRGVAGVDGLVPIEMVKGHSAYKLRPGLNAISADNIIQGHNDYRRTEVTELIWSAARMR